MILKLFQYDYFNSFYPSSQEVGIINSWKYLWMKPVINCTNILQAAFLRQYSFPIKLQSQIFIREKALKKHFHTQNQLKTFGWNWYLNIWKCSNTFLFRDESAVDGIQLLSFLMEHTSVNLQTHAFKLGCFKTNFNFVL